MKVAVQQDKCVAAGQCVHHAEGVRQAAAVCPALAVHIEE
jgi:ferredoxin